VSNGVTARPAQPELSGRRLRASRFGICCCAQGSGRRHCVTKRWSSPRRLLSVPAVGSATGELDSFFQKIAVQLYRMVAFTRVLSPVCQGPSRSSCSHPVNITELTGEFPPPGKLSYMALPLQTPVKLLARTVARRETTYCKRQLNFSTKARSSRSAPSPGGLPGTHAHPDGAEALSMLGLPQRHEKRPAQFKPGRTSRRTACRWSSAVSQAPGYEAAPVTVG